MTVSLDNANNYFKYHKLREFWDGAILDIDQEDVLTQAQNMLTTAFNLREGYEESSSFEFAVYEQAIHLLSYEKERYLTQSQGVKLFSYDGIQVQQEQSLISPIAMMFLKKLIYRKVGKVK
jgi:hypothetical protein